MKGTRFLDRCAAAVYLAVERLLPVGKKQCFISFPPVEDNAFALFLEVMRRKQYDIGNLVWLANDPELAVSRLKGRLGHQKGSTIRVIKRKSLRGILCFLRAERVYFTHNHYGFVRRGSKPDRLINLWHGMPLKAIGFLDRDNKTLIPASDVTIASSEFFRPIVAQAIGLPENNVMVTGLPRCDQLFATTKAARALRVSLLAGASKLVLWMPTYRFNIVGPSRTDSRSSKKTSLARFVQDMETLSRLGQENQCAVVIKLHPMDFLSGERLPAMPGLTVLRPDAPAFVDCGLYDLLAVADGLITDLSSVCFDFMATRRPILITRDFTFSYTRELLFDPDKLFAAVFTSENWQGADSFFTAIRSEQKLSAEALAKFCKFDDAGSAGRVLDCLQALDRSTAARTPPTKWRRGRPTPDMPHSVAVRSGVIAQPQHTANDPERGH